MRNNNLRRKTMSLVPQEWIDAQKAKLKAEIAMTNDEINQSIRRILQEQAAKRGEDLAEPPANLDFAKSLDAVTVARDYLVTGWPRYVRVLSAVVAGCESAIRVDCRIVLPMRHIIRAKAKDHALALIWIFDNDDGNQKCEETTNE
jgi:hypothetical protein